MKKKALIFGVTGQDGSYLSEILLKKNYQVHGVKRRSSSINTQRVDHIYQDPHEYKRRFILHYGDITDSTSVSKIAPLIANLPSRYLPLKPTSNAFFAYFLLSNNFEHGYK